MTSPIAKIGEIEGRFYVISADGSTSELSQGDEIFEGESVVGAQSNSKIDSVMVSLRDASKPFVILSNEKQFFDASLVETTEFSQSETVFKPSNIALILEEDDNNYLEKNEESKDDFILMNLKNDTIYIGCGDVNGKLIVDSEEGRDKAIFFGNYDEYSVSTNEDGYTIVEEISTGDISKFKNIEKVEFSNAEYKDGKFNSSQENNHKKDATLGDYKEYSENIPFGDFMEKTLKYDFIKNKSAKEKLFLEDILMDDSDDF